MQTTERGKPLPIILTVTCSSRALQGERSARNPGRVSHTLPANASADDPFAGEAFANHRTGEAPIILIVTCSPRASKLITSAPITAASAAPPPSPPPPFPHLRCLLHLRRCPHHCLLRSLPVRSLARCSARGETAERACVTRKLVGKFAAFCAVKKSADIYSFPTILQYLMSIFSNLRPLPRA